MHPPTTSMKTMPTNVPQIAKTIVKSVPAKCMISGDEVELITGSLIFATISEGVVSTKIPEELLEETVDFTNGRKKEIRSPALAFTFERIEETLSHNNSVLAGKKLGLTLTVVATRAGVEMACDVPILLVCSVTCVFPAFLEEKVCDSARVLRGVVDGIVWEPTRVKGVERFIAVPKMRTIPVVERITGRGDVKLDDGLGIVVARSLRFVHPTMSTCR